MVKLCSSAKKGRFILAYAVVDFETTGLHPSFNHRVVEIGVTHVEDDGTITGQWETLVNPGRDLGPQNIHSIRAADLIDAPRFEDIVGDVVELLTNRTFVGHNAHFDLRFLLSELTFSGIHIDENIPHLCTMKLSRSFQIPGRGSLDHCCSYFNIELVDAHTAGADSYATAQLLGAYIRNSMHLDDWNRYWAHVSRLGYSVIYPNLEANKTRWKARSTAIAAPKHFLELITDPPIQIATQESGMQYLGVLDRCLLDGVISASEQAQLVATAESLGLRLEDVQQLHKDYFAVMIDRARTDGELADQERKELLAVATLLQINKPEELISAPSEYVPSSSWNQAEFMLEAGAHIVLTGTMMRERSDWEEIILKAGYVPYPRVTKKTKLLVAADPDSLSGKARQARSYGVPVVDEQWFAKLLGL